MDNVKKVNEELTIAGQLTPEQFQQAAQEGFKSILNLRSPLEQGFLSDEQQQVEAAGLEYFHIPVKPNAISEELTTGVLKQIDELPKPTLIHCAAGMRAATMALMNLATRQGLTPEQVFARTTELGFDSNANPQLKQFIEDYISGNQLKK
ncbi:protein tyrosine phosphatase family protein [Calothrix sp. UHCC 0171]|uniref:protein tyrosine phosphatase family protein n=1 Tax=Calothrix sp. UHCC 0171 TaxID=3110245 RepID=UPI002B20A43E|nr:protein tyrosine phosphatase family protein [Calothrix sp. UHCC 0171]MEA5574353.1 protein tyrosine phosphatase family protein [Calothrix sp. UHCC 0171]